MNTATLPECRLIIVNEITGKRCETILPCSPSEAKESCIEITRAIRFADHLECVEFCRESTSEPLGVVIQHNDFTTTVRWYTDGDVEAARERMAEIERGAT